MFFQRSKRFIYMVSFNHRFLFPFASLHATVFDQLSLAGMYVWVWLRIPVLPLWNIRPFVGNIETIPVLITVARILPYFEKVLWPCLYCFIAQFSKQTIQWLQLAEGFNRALKVGCFVDLYETSACQISAWSIVLAGIIGAVITIFISM